MSRMQKLTGGWSTWRWLSGINAKEKSWFLGSLRGRAGYQAWMAHLSRGLSDPTFIMAFESTSDPWEGSKLVGQKIRVLRKTFVEMTDEQRSELARQAETEFKTGLELMGRDKKTIQDLITFVDPPATQ